MRKIVHNATARTTLTLLSYDFVAGLLLDMTLTGTVAVMDLMQVTSKIIATKVRKGLQWRDIAAHIGQSKEWTTAACLGQMTLTKFLAVAAQDLSELSDKETEWLQILTCKGSPSTAVPTDSLI